MSIPGVVWRMFLLACNVLSALAAGQVLNKFLIPRPGWGWRLLRYFTMMVAISCAPVYWFSRPAPQARSP